MATILLRHGSTSAASRRLHRILNVATDTSPAEVRRAFLALALTTHPDHNTRPDAERQMAELVGAWREYADEQRRRGEHVPGFTAFGIGCSWTDDQLERAEREFVTDMASRGVLPRAAVEATRAGVEDPVGRHDEAPRATSGRDGLESESWRARGCPG